MKEFSTFADGVDCEDCASYEKEIKKTRNKAIDECIKALQNDLPKGEIETEAANLYTGGMHRAIYVLERLKSEG